MVQQTRCVALRFPSHTAFNYAKDILPTSLVRGYGVEMCVRAEKTVNGMIILTL